LTTLNDAVGDRSANDQTANILAFIVISTLSILILPIPGPLMDALLAVSVALSVLALLVALRISRPLDFSVFPAFLLLTTLFRLGLNVATTRLILLHGGNRDGATGELIRAFGEFAVGGSVLVGAVVFLILLVVNFMVISKGATRISEVAARFTLDALPGKQMSIDADLAAGAINDQEAQRRRAELAQEAEFFGSMDGASKFVRGDAVAGLIITIINLIGGLLAGLVRDNMDLATAMKNYTVLTVGDGLLSQMPALFISVAAGVVVTKAGTRSELGHEMRRQLLGQPAVLLAVAFVLGLMGFLPGMPFLAFAVVSVTFVALASRARTAKQKAAKATRRDDAKRPTEQRAEDLLQVEAIELEVGLGLVSLIDGPSGGELPGRVTALRKQVAQELGLVLPQIHLKDSLTLAPNNYRVLLRGVTCGEGVAYLDRQMVIDPRGGVPDLKGISATEPTFGLPVRWIERADVAAAERKGYSLVDPASVVTTHLGEVLRANAHELVGRQEVQELLNVVARSNPKLVEDVVPGVVTLGELAVVTRHLLQEGVSVRDYRSIIEAVADAAAKNKEPHFLTEAVRKQLGRAITARVATEGTLYAVTLLPETEHVLRASLGHDDGHVVLAPDLQTAQALLESLRHEASRLATQGHATVVLAPPDLRRPLYLFASRFIPDLSVVAARELAPGTRIERSGEVRIRPVLAA
jgi:flagellar biosynthesis protein FlhA